MTLEVYQEKAEAHARACVREMQLSVMINGRQPALEEWLSEIENSMRKLLRNVVPEYAAEQCLRNSVRFREVGDDAMADRYLERSQYELQR